MKFKNVKVGTRVRAKSDIHNSYREVVMSEGAMGTIMESSDPHLPTVAWDTATKYTYSTRFGANTYVTPRCMLARI